MISIKRQLRFWFVNEVVFVLTTATEHQAISRVYVIDREGKVLLQDPLDITVGVIRAWNLQHLASGVSG